MYCIKAFIAGADNVFNLHLMIKCPSIDEVSVFLDRVHFDFYDRVIVEPIEFPQED